MTGLLNNTEAGRPYEDAADMAEEYATKLEKKIADIVDDLSHDIGELSKLDAKYDHSADEHNLLNLLAVCQWAAQQGHGGANKFIEDLAEKAAKDMEL